MKKFYLLSLLTFFAFSSLAHSEVRELPFYQEKTDYTPTTEVRNVDEDYFTIKSVKVKDITEEMTESELDEVKEAYLNESEKGLGEIIMMANKLIALGKKVWQIVEAGRPVVQTSFQSAISVLPRVLNQEPENAFYEMANWSMPTVKKYRVLFENLFGADVIKFDYVVVFQHSGTYQGKGQYLTGVKILAKNVSVSWGFSFDASSSLMTISNRGSSENPVAGATLELKYTAKSVLREIKTQEVFHLTGRGTFRPLY